MGWSYREGKRPAGNGEGRFFYPPISIKNGAKVELTDKIIGSYRLEMLREGVEDYDYLTMLKLLLKEKGDTLSASEREKCEKLLIVPEEITKSVIEFSRDPKYIEKRRAEVARAIEKLNSKKITIPQPLGLIRFFDFKSFCVFLL